MCIRDRSRDSLPRHSVRHGDRKNLTPAIGFNNRSCAMNVEWHQMNAMPKRATTEQRIAWHTEHQKYCDCRPIPPKLRLLMQRPAADDTASSSPNEIRSLLTGGDRRSIADSNRVRP